MDINNLNKRQLTNYKKHAEQLNITLKEYLEKRNNGFKWCDSCKKWLLVSTYFTNEKRKYCRICTNEKSKGNYQKGKNNKLKKCKIYRKSQKGLFYSYKTGALKRKMIFNLSFEEFILFWQKPCFYCGDKIETIGIDRVDNNTGYNIKNIVSSCFVCNRMKSNNLMEKWILKLKQISDKMSLK